MYAVLRRCRTAVYTHSLPLAGRHLSLGKYLSSELLPSTIVTDASCLPQAKAAVKPEVDAMFGNFHAWYKMAQDDPTNDKLPVPLAKPVGVYHCEGKCSGPPMAAMVLPNEHYHAASDPSCCIHSLLLAT